MKIIPRRLLHRIRPFLRRREIVAIQGPRQAGKTTLLRMIYERTPPPKAFVNMDIPAESEALSRDPLTFVRRHLPEGKGTLFIDEVQRVTNAGDALKIIYDTLPDVKIFISGSSSLRVRTDVATRLVGRIVTFTLLTFDFNEFLLSRDPGLAKVQEEAQKAFLGTLTGRDEPQPPVYGEEIGRRLEEYIIYGGYPAVALEEREDVRRKLLQEIATLYVEKDVVAYFNVAEVGKFLRFATALSASIGTPLRISSLAESSGIAFKTAERFISILQQSFIVDTIQPFHRNLVTELRKSPKAYFLDTGLRNAVIENFLPLWRRTDAGALLENFVFRELRVQELRLRYWRTTAKAEVDFVILTEEGPIPIEVKMHGKPTRGFYSFLRTYKPQNAIVVTWDRFGKAHHGETTIWTVPAWYA